MLAAAILLPLKMINIKGKSYRLKEKVKAGGKREGNVKTEGRGE